MQCPRCLSDVSNDSLYCNYCGKDLLRQGLDSSGSGETRGIADDAPVFKEGELFGTRYRIKEEVGRGGMGRVYRAEDKVLGIDVALKVIRPEYISNKMMIKRFKKEILLAREITHENVVRIHDFGEIDNIKFISMEYIEGKSLKDLINSPEPIPIDRIIDIAIKICRGLTAAHKKGIVHRDLKPQNVMIDKDDHIFITDFGLAKSTVGESISQTGIIIGTPQYISPEQWRGEMAVAQSDIYTLGIIIYEMLCGHSLFDSDSDLGYLQKHLNEQPKFNKDESGNIPLFLKKIVMKCLEKELKYRYRSCEDVMNDLEGKSYSEIPVLQRVQKYVKSNLRYSPVFIALLLLTIAFLFRFKLNLVKAEGIKKRSVAVIYFNNLTGDKNFDYLKYSLNDLLITDLAQSKFIRVLQETKLFRILNRIESPQFSELTHKMMNDIRNEGNVNYIIAGSFNKSGNTLRISTRLIDSETGELVDSNSVDTDSGRIFSAVDRITRNLKKSFRLTDDEIYRDIDPDIENITTSSQEALKYYIRGKRLLNMGKYEESLVPFMKAVEIDPEFAMGYRQIAWAYAYQGEINKRKKYFEKTFEHTDKLSEKEKLLVYADYYGEKEVTQLKALEYYKKILKIYPDDVDTNFILGIFYRDLENWDEAIKYLKTCLEIDDKKIEALNELVNIYFSKKKYSEAAEIIEKFRKDHPALHPKKVLILKLLLKLIKGETDAASLLIDELNRETASEKGKDRYFKGKIYFLENRIDKMENEFEEQKRFYKDFHFRLDLIDQKNFDLTTGKIESVISIYKKDISGSGNNLLKFFKYSELLNILYRNKLRSRFNEFFDKIDFKPNTDFPYFDVQYYYLKSLKFLIEGREKEAEKMVEKFERLMKKSIYSRDFKRKRLFLLAELSRIKGEYKDSEKYLLNAIDILPGVNTSGFRDSTQVQFLYTIAKLYFDKGEFNESELWLKKLFNLNIANYSYGDLYVKSFFYLGKIYLAKNWNGKALELFKKLIEFWKNGDEFFTKKYIREAKEKLSSLR